MASLPGAVVSLMPVYPQGTEYEKGLSFEDWVVRIFKLQDESDSLVQAMKGLLAEPTTRWSCHLADEGAAQMPA